MKAYIDESIGNAHREIAFGFAAGEYSLFRGIGKNTDKGGKELFNFGKTAAKHMTEKGRAVPVQILEQAIKGSKGVADP